MRVTFNVSGVSAQHWLYLPVEDAWAILQAAGLTVYSTYAPYGKVPVEQLTRVLASIELKIASPSLKEYVRLPAKGRMVIINRDGSNVVKVEHGPQVEDQGLDEPSVRLHLARLYILITAAVQVGKPLYWGLIRRSYD